MSKDRKGELSTALKKKYRKACGERDGWFCKMCGIALVPEEEFGNPKYFSVSTIGFIPKPGFSRATLDHIFPLSKENIKDLSNFQLLCHDCNAKKGDSIE